MSHLSSSGERAKSDRSTTYESRAFESRAIASLNVDAPSSNARRMTVAAESDTATEHLRQHLLDSRRIRSMRKGSFWRSDYEYHSRFMSDVADIMGPAPAGSYAQNEHLVPQLVSRVAAFEHELAHNAGPTVFQDCVLLALLVVSVPPPSAIVPPLPESAPTLWLPPLRSNAPPLTVSAPPDANAPPAPSCNVPAPTVVPPV